MSDNRKYPARPMVGVGVVVLKGDDVLLIQRAKPPKIGEWSLPGGLQELGETAVEAARREVLEETGVAIRVGQLIDVFDIIRHDADRRVETHYTLIDFAAEWLSGEPVGGDDALHAEFVHISRIEEFGMWSETVRAIRMAAALRPAAQAAD